MGCCCQKKSKIEEPLLPEIIEEEKEEEEEEEEEKKEEEEEKIIEIIDPFELNFEKARKIVELCLSKDNLYGKFWNYISSFNQEQFKNLFQGNLDYKNYPELEEIEKIEFKFLLMRFEDYFSILFEWYQDESKYNNIVKLWNSKLCIYKLKDNSNTEIKSILQNLGISDIDNFLFELRPIINNSKESKSSNIKNYLEIQYKDFDTLIEVTQNSKKEFHKSDIPNKEDVETVLTNLVGELAKRAFPLIKNYICDKYPSLKDISQLESGMINKLKNNITGLLAVENKSIFANGLSYKTLSPLIEAFKNGNLYEKIIEEGGLHYGTPAVAITTLTMSFLSLATSIKSYYDYTIDMENKIEKYTEKSKIIQENFEMHKKQIRTINLDNYEESMRKIEEIGKKLNNDKNDFKALIDEVNDEIKKTEEKEKSSGYKEVAKKGLAVVGCGLGCFLTGGTLAIGYAVAGVMYGVSAVNTIAELLKMKEKVRICKEKIEDAEKQKEEIDESLKDLKNKFNQIQQDLFR